MNVAVLDYSTGDVIIYKDVPYTQDEDLEKWLSINHNLNDIYYMCGESLTIKTENFKDIKI